jgi:hypothetical protein
LLSLFAAFNGRCVASRTALSTTFLSAAGMGNESSFVFFAVFTVLFSSASVETAGAAVAVSASVGRTWICEMDARFPGIRGDEHAEPLARRQREHSGRAGDAAGVRQQAVAARALLEEGIADPWETRVVGELLRQRCLHGARIEDCTPSSVPP